MKTLNIVKRIILQIYNDKRSLMLIIFVPILLFSLIYLLLGESGYKPSIVQSSLPAPLVEKIKAQGLTVTEADSSEGRRQVEAGETDAYIYLDVSGIHMLFEVSDATKMGIIQKVMSEALKELSPSGSMSTEVLYGGSKDNMFDSLAYVLLGIVSFFIIFIIAGISFVRERTSQTMERLMITPVRRWQVVTGYTLGFGFFAALQSIVLLVYAVSVLKMSVAGSVVNVGFIMILLALSAVCIGAFFSIFSNNEFQMMQFIPLIVVPQIFFSGLISLDTLPYHLGLLSRIMPVYYACHALSSVIIKGCSLGDIMNDIYALLAFIFIFSLINIFALKKYRKI